MTKKQKAALIAAVLAVLSAAGAAVAGNVKADSTGERVRAVEVRIEDIKPRLERMEIKLDHLLERRNP